jgi:hypothetical protein
MVPRPPPNPLFYGKKQRKTRIQALYRSNLTLQVVDFIFIQQEFPYAAEQRNLAAEQGN